MARNDQRDQDQDMGMQGRDPNDRGRGGSQQQDTWRNTGRGGPDDMNRRDDMRFGRGNQDDMYRDRERFGSDFGGRESQSYGQGQRFGGQDRFEQDPQHRTSNWPGSEHAGGWGQGSMGGWGGQQQPGGWNQGGGSRFGGGMGSGGGFNYGQGGGFGGSSQGGTSQGWGGMQGTQGGWSREGQFRRESSEHGYGQHGGFGMQDRERGRFYGHGPKGYQRSDERIQEEVNEELYRDSDVDASEIEVKVQNGEVTLTGTVDDRHTKRMAEDCVWKVSGVREVVNMLRVNGERAGQSRSEHRSENRSEDKGGRKSTKVGTEF